MTQDPHCRACLRYGWTAVAAFLLLGLFLESLHLIKASFYMDLRIRQELWTLAHAHGTLLAVLNLLFALSGEHCIVSERARQLGSQAMRAGALLVPVGFFLGGIGTYEGDPSLFVVFVPIGAVLVFLATAQLAWGAWSQGKGPASQASTAGTAPKTAKRARKARR